MSVIKLGQQGVALKKPLEFEPGQVVWSLGGVIEENRISAKYFEVNFLGVWGELSPGPGFGAIMGGGKSVCGETKEHLRELILARYGRPSYKPDFVQKARTAEELLMDEAKALLAELDRTHGTADQA